MKSENTFDPVARLFSVVAIIEAITWLGLLVGMWMKYGSLQDPILVKWFGRLHGVAFIAYVVVTWLAARRLCWSFKDVLFAFLAAIPPLLTLPLEIWFRRRGLLMNPSQPPFSQSKD